MAIENFSALNPITINGATVQDKAQLEVGDVIQVLGHRFVWQREENPASGSDSELEASFQIGACYCYSASVHASVFFR